MIDGKEGGSMMGGMREGMTDGITGDMTDGTTESVRGQAGGSHPLRPMWGLGHDLVFIDDFAGLVGQSSPSSATSASSSASPSSLDAPSAPVSSAGFVAASALSRGSAFIRSSFSSQEIRQARQRAATKNDSFALHLAGRWAAKESFVKAWCQLLSLTPSSRVEPASDGSLSQDGSASSGGYPYSLENFPWKEIEIITDAHGAPSLRLSAKLDKAFCGSLDLASDQPVDFRLSISHDGHYASAVLGIDIR